MHSAGVLLATAATIAGGMAWATSFNPPGAAPSVAERLKLIPSFIETFDRKLDPKRWTTSFGPMPDAKATIANRALYGNRERQVYVDPGYLGLGLNPFAVRDGMLTIRAQPLTPRARAAAMAELATLPQKQRQSALKDVAYSSGLITTRGRFAQRYGYFEVRARWSQGKGIWPAFWLLPKSGAWPPELDVIEAHGDKPGVVFQTKHSKAEPSQPKRVTVPGGNRGFHRYGMLWTPRALRFYIDGRETVRTTPPPDAREPMYLLANLAIGGHWPGDPDPETKFPATLTIDEIRVWKLPADWQEARLADLDG